MGRSYLRSLREITTLHAKAESYSVFVNQEIAAANGGISPHPLCGAALFSMAADQLSLHRAVLNLCDAGWAFSSTMLIRVMIDIFLSILVLIEKEEEAEYRGVKYTHRFCKATFSDKSSIDSERKNARQQIEDVLRRASPTLRDRLKEYFFKAKLGSYWYSPDFKGPSDIIKKLAVSEIESLYKQFSGAAHGSYLGLRILKDDPDSIHPNRRSDRRSQNMALAFSTRLLLESTFARDSFENASRTRPIYEKLVGRLSDVMALPAFSMK